MPGRLPRAGESRGRRWCCRGGRRAGPQGSARWRKTVAVPVARNRPDYCCGGAGVSRGSQDPDEAAQRLCHLHADGGDGVLQEQVQSWKEQSTDVQSWEGGICGATATHPFPRPGPCLGPSRIPALLHHPRKEELHSRDAGPLCQPHQRPRGGTGTPVPLRAPPRTPQLCSPGDGCHGSRTALPRLPALPGPGAVGPRGPWGTGLKLVGLLLRRPGGGGNSPQRGGPGPGRGAKPPRGRADAGRAKPPLSARFPNAWNGSR